MRVAELHKELYQSKQGTQSMTEFFTSLSTIWEELDNFRPVPECKCRVKCTCDAFSDVLKHREDDRVIRFITGLNDNYSMVQNQVLLMDPLPDPDRAFSMVVQFERQNGLCVVPKEPEALINAVDGRRGPGSFGRGRGNSSRMCTHCGRPGHTVEYCYKKHGYPPGYFKRGGKDGVSINAAGSDTDDGTNKEGASGGYNISADEYKEYRTLISLIKANSVNKEVEQEKPSSSAASISLMSYAGITFVVL